MKYYMEFNQFIKLLFPIGWDQARSCGGKVRHTQKSQEGKVKPEGQEHRVGLAIVSTRKIPSGLAAFCPLGHLTPGEKGRTPSPEEAPPSLGEVALGPGRKPHPAQGR